MKITRNKKSHKILTFFNTHFKYREPYQILIDATFAQAALQNRVIIEEQISKYLQTQLKLVTTQCVILEAESLGAPLVGATQIVKKFYVHKCGHEGKPVAAAECIRQMTRSSRYIVASQDRSLQESLRKLPGKCLLYLHRAAPVLEAPSDVSRKWVQRKVKKLLTTDCDQQIHVLKEKQNVKSPPDNPIRKRKRPKNPNPLSCKKSKKPKAKTDIKTQQTLTGNSVNSKRKRIRISAHIKEALKNKTV